MKYQLTKNGDLIASGTFDECWVAMLDHAGDRTLSEVKSAGYLIEPTTEQADQSENQAKSEE